MRIITSKEVPAYEPLNCKASKNIVSCELQDKVTVTDKKSGAYVIEKEVVETSRVDTQAYIDSFKDDVGIENILRKFNMVNDPELLNQVKRPTVPIGEDGKEVIQDYTGIPTTEEEALKIAKRAMTEFDNLPKELTKGRTFNQFAESCTKEELLTYISSMNQKKEGEGNE